MKNKLVSPLTLLFDNIEGPNLLLEYYANFSKRIFGARDFKSVINILYEELRKVYVNQQIEVILWHNNQRLVKFLFNEQKNEMLPVADFSEKNTLYNYVLEKRQVILTNNYKSFCENSALNSADLPAGVWLGIPLKVRGKVLGALVVWDEGNESYLRLQDKQFLTSLSDMVSFAVESIYLYDYIVEKNDTYKLFETALPKKITRNSARSVLLELLNTVVRQSDVQYTALFLSSRQQNKWQLLSERFEEDLFSKTGLALAERLTNLSESLFQETEYLFWHQHYLSHPLYDFLAEPFKDLPVNSALFFPFRINSTYLGSWVIGFQRESDQPATEEIQLFRFFFYIIIQLLEKKALLDRTRKYEQYLKHAERMKVMGEVANNMVHHLNNILSVIIGKGEMLEKKLAESPHQRDLELLLQAAKDGANSLYLFQQHSVNGKLPEQKTSIHINDLIEEVLENVRPRFEQEARSQGIHYDIAREFGKVKAVIGDPAGLREVFLNIIHNAFDAMPGGGTLKIQTAQKESNLLIFISDTGIGVSQENIDKIFNPFFTTKGKHGNGLGLSIAADIIQKHKGTIHVDSIPQKGSVFMMELPTIEDEQITEVHKADFLHSLSHTVLLVEDENIVRETLAELLDDEGCEVIVAADPHDALYKFKKHSCDVVFTDLTMKALNGVELAQKLKKINPAVPVFIITGSNENHPALKNASDIIDGIIRKPFSMDLIRRELLRVAKGSRSYKKDDISLEV